MIYPLSYKNALRVEPIWNFLKFCSILTSFFVFQASTQRPIRSFQPIAALNGPSEIQHWTERENRKLDHNAKREVRSKQYKNWVVFRNSITEFSRFLSFLTEWRTIGSYDNNSYLILWRDAREWFKVKIKGPSKTGS